MEYRIDTLDMRYVIIDVEAKRRHEKYFYLRNEKGLILTFDTIRLAEKYIKSISATTIMSASKKVNVVI